MASPSRDDWCFGMIMGLRPVVLPQYVIGKTPISLRLLDDGITLYDEETAQVFGSTISSRTEDIINALGKELSLQIHADYGVPHTAKPTPASPRKSVKVVDSPAFVLNIVIYGPDSLFEAVGVFATRCGIYLQHPMHCSRNVPYRNPHCLSLEQGCRWALDGRYQDIWKAEVDGQGQKVYYNYITGQKQTRRPEQFRGGLLIDAPGLGKSLSILALMATDLESQTDHTPIADRKCQTLLVVPKSLIETWKDELSKHLKPSTHIRSCVYYGKGRKALLENLNGYTLLVTTYSVVRLDWNEQRKRADRERTSLETLHDVFWRRVVLDEAHIAREPSKTFANSVCALHADRRWAVTGTPIQNRLTDLYSLFKFLQCYPFCDLKVFNSHVTQNWKASDPIAIAKLKNLVNCLSIRRPKHTIELPARQDITIPIELDAEELQLYRAVQCNTRQNLEAATGANFLNALKLVNQLRLICNHGLQCNGATQLALTLPMTRQPWTQKAAQLRFDHLDEVGLAKCSNPSCNQDLASALSSEMDHEHEDEPYVEEGLMVLCAACYADRPKNRLGYLRVCNHLPRRPTEEVDKDMLDPGNSLLSVQSQGRAKVLRAFRDNEGIRVLLATISCGGVGLDLTAASRAFIIEPQWNPMSESQALDRVHRLGQTKEVVTTRYITKGTWEELVVTVQRKKQELADLTLSSGPINKAEVTSGRLQYLKQFVD
ncbi:MAG: hypothetical protein Q9218_001670 [Villophora microphyllina]